MHAPLRPILAVAIATAAGALHSGAAAQSALPPEELFVLGDSLSDVGNAAAVADFLLGLSSTPEHTLGLCNPADVYLFMRGCEDVLFRRSRVSDGPVAVEHLAAHLGLAELAASLHTVPERPVVGTNYAVASAKARGDDLEDLSSQVDMLLLDRAAALSPTALYVVMIGGNDAIDALQAAVLPPVGDPGGGDAPPTGENGDTTGAAAAGAAIVAAAVEAIGTNIDRLVGAGATRLLVANVPDIAALPAVRAGAAETGDAEAALGAAAAMSAAFNEQLDARLDRVEADHVGVILGRVDLRASMDGERTSAELLGLNVVDACFDSRRYFSSPTAQRAFHPDCAPADGAPRFDRFFFWDGLHPTGRVHAAVGNALIAAFEGAAPAAVAVAERGTAALGVPGGAVPRVAGGAGSKGASPARRPAAR